MPYRVVRFKFKGKRRVIKSGLTLKEADEIVNRPTSKGDGWFYGREPYKEPKSRSKRR